MHRRGYMDYHAERFTDASLLIFYRNRLFALLPANAEGDTIVSHRGLSYGGLLLDNRADVAEVGACWEHIFAFLLERGYKHLIYKAVPSFYHRSPAFEDLFGLRWHREVTLLQTDMGAVVDLSNPLPFSRRKKRNIRKASRSGLLIAEKAADVSVFWEKILTPNLLTRHGVMPVHRVDEMVLLMNRFPENIRFYGTYSGERLIAGTVLYLTSVAVHAQYIAADSEGKAVCALDFLFADLLQRFRCARQHRYFSFGISTFDKGQALNCGLARWKEEFGARTWLHETLFCRLAESGN